MTALGRTESFSRKGYVTIEEHPELHGVKITLGSDSSKFANEKSPERTSGLAKKITTSGSSESFNRSYLLKTMNLAGALNEGISLIASSAISGVFM